MHFFDGNRLSWRLQLPSECPSFHFFKDQSVRLCEVRAEDRDEPNHGQQQHPAVETASVHAGLRVSTNPFTQRLPLVAVMSGLTPVTVSFEARPAGSPDPLVPAPSAAAAAAESGGLPAPAAALVEEHAPAREPQRLRLQPRAQLKQERPLPSATPPQDQRIRVGGGGVDALVGDVRRV